MVTKEDKNILMSQTIDTLHEWNYLLNGWGWPKELPNEELQKDWTLSGRRNMLSIWIMEHTGGYREFLFYANVIKEKCMTEATFNLFYSGAILGHKKNYKKYVYRVWRKIQDDGSPPPEDRFRVYFFIWRLIFMVNSKAARKFTEKVFLFKHEMS